MGAKIDNSMRAMVGPVGCKGVLTVAAGTYGNGPRTACAGYWWLNGGRMSRSTYAPPVRAKLCWWLKGVAMGRKKRMGTFLHAARVRGPRPHP